MTPDAITRAFTRALAAARETYSRQRHGLVRADLWGKYLVNLTFHDLRHEATTRLAKLFALHELCKITGHRDSKMLLRYYHPDMAELAKRLP